MSDQIVGLVGAVIGGLMGFIGAWVVSSSANARERRAAARLLAIDLQLVQAVCVRIVEEEKNRPPEFSRGAWIAAQLAMHRQSISATFEEQVSRVAHTSARLTPLLIAFLAVTKRLDAYASATLATARDQSKPLTSASYDEGMVALDFDKVHLLIVRCLYWLRPEYQSWWWPRYVIRRDRYLIPDAEDEAMKANFFP
jgi:hypothetical protein